MNYEDFENLALGLLTGRRVPRTLKGMINFWGRTSLAATVCLTVGIAGLGFSACVAEKSSVIGGAERLPASDSAGNDLSSLLTKDDIVQSIGAEVASNRFPAEANFAVGAIPVTARLTYGLQVEEQGFAEKMLAQYRPDYGVFVAMDARTGRIMTMASRIHGRDTSENLALRASFPAASIFKVVTAGAVLDTERVSPNTRIAFNGANHTLYKHNVVGTSENRWTRRMTIREAFGSSVNTIFGKLGLFYAGPEMLREYAQRFHFNHPIRADVPIQTGYSRFTADDPWSVVSAASGFTLDNTMSPIQGAMIAAAVANDGVMMEPYVVDAVHDSQGNSLYQAAPRRAAIVVGPETARKLRELFEQTVIAGTSRKAFRQAFRQKSFGAVEFGGKTGSLTGFNPRGKCDWFIGYARFGDQRVAVAALTVNEDKWRVKSAALAQMFLTQYIRTHN